MPNAYGIDEDGLVNGLLAGARFKALNEDLKLAKLQNAEFKATEGHRRTMDLLQRELTSTKLANEDHYTAIAELEKRKYEQAIAFAEEDRPDNVSRRKSETSEASSRARSAKNIAQWQEDDRPLAQREMLAQVEGREAQTSRQKAEAVGAQLDTTGKLAGGYATSQTHPELNDIVGFMQSAGVDPKAMNTIGSYLYELIEGKKAEYRMIVSENEQNAARIRNEGIRDQSAAFGQAVTAGINLGSVAAQNPGVLAEYEQSIDPNDPMGKITLAIAKGGVAKYASPAEKEYADQVGKQLGVLMQRQLALEEAVTQESPYTFTTTKTYRKDKQKELDRVKSQIETLTRRMEEGIKARGKSASVTAKPFGMGKDTAKIPVITTEEQFNKLAPGSDYKLEGDDTIYTKGG